MPSNIPVSFRAARFAANTDRRKAMWKIQIGEVKYLRDTQEYKVPVFVDGIYNEAKSYYASDKDDAEATRLALAVSAYSSRMRRQDKRKARIEALRADARERGDGELVLICDNANWGDRRAISICLQVIRTARQEAKR